MSFPRIASTARLSASDPCAGLLGGLGTGRPSLGGVAAALLPQPDHGGLGIFSCATTRRGGRAPQVADVRGGKARMMGVLLHAPLGRLPVASPRWTAAVAGSTPALRNLTNTRGGLPTLLLPLFPRQAAATSSLPMAELPPVGTVVWMKTSGKPVRASIYTGQSCGLVLLRFDDMTFGDGAGSHLRLLLVAAFWSALDSIEVAK